LIKSTGLLPPPVIVEKSGGCVSSALAERGTKRCPQNGATARAAKNAPNRTNIYQKFMPC
jgi:hypothetical protein